MSGLRGWVTWLVVHLWYLAGFQNSVLVLVAWLFSFVSRERHARVIAAEGPPAPIGAPMQPRSDVPASYRAA